MFGKITREKAWVAVINLTIDEIKTIENIIVKYPLASRRTKADLEMMLKSLKEIQGNALSIKNTLDSDLTLRTGEVKFKT